MQLDLIAIGYPITTTVYTTPQYPPPPVYVAPQYPPPVVYSAPVVNPQYPPPPMVYPAPGNRILNVLY